MLARAQSIAEAALRAFAENRVTALDVSETTPPAPLARAMPSSRVLGRSRKVTSSLQRSPLHAAGCRRCLHFGKCALQPELVPSVAAAPTRAVTNSLEKSRIPFWFYRRRRKG
jgi:hypothetical protein